MRVERESILDFPLKALWPNGIVSSPCQFYLMMTSLSLLYLCSMMYLCGKMTSLSLLFTLIEIRFNNVTNNEGGTCWCTLPVRAISNNRDRYGKISTLLQPKASYIYHGCSTEVLSYCYMVTECSLPVNTSATLNNYLIVMVLTGYCKSERSALAIVVLELYKY